MGAHRRSVHLAVSCAAVVLVAGCAKSDSKSTPAATDSAAGAVAPAGAPAAAPMAAPIAVADVAGKWNVVAVPVSGDTTPTKFVLVVAAPNAWKQTYENGQVVTPKVVLAGDSIITDAGPYPSVRRKGVKVVTHGVLRKQGDKLTGTTTAHYQIKGADSVITLRVEGTRAP